jgi:hypothetical protein
VTQILAQAPRRDLRQRRTVLVVRPVRANSEPAWIDADRLQLGLRSFDEVTGEEAEDDPVARLERVEQREDAR